MSDRERERKREIFRTVIDCDIPKMGGHSKISANLRPGGGPIRKQLANIISAVLMSSRVCVMIPSEIAI